MKYTDLKIQTQREAPNNARTEGFAFLVRAGYLTRENELTPLGQEAIARLRKLSEDPAFLSLLSISTVGNEQETYFPLSNGDTEIIHCASCQYTERLELAEFEKNTLAHEEELPLEKLLTPDCNTIEALASFLNVPKEKTAKALMYTHISDEQFIFVVVRGDMQLSETKLKNIVGDIRAATEEEIIKAGAVPGYASPIGLKSALILVDDLIPKSQNLVAGANEAGYHFKNTNYPRDYIAETIADMVQAKAGDSCMKCGTSLSVFHTLELVTHSGFNLENILLALAETHHDQKGLILPKSAAPYDVHLMHVPGKQIDTHAEATKIYDQLKGMNVSVLFDDRDERAGVKFNDADLIGCPLRVTVGEKALQNGMVELKLRSETENQLVALEELPARLK
jgi:prolyl-tRNA synthetase